MLCLLAGRAMAEAGVFPDRVVLGMANALSGPAAALGTELRDGALACFARINADGGVNGRRIELVSLDVGGESGDVLVEFAVADEGIGIAEAARGGLFQALSQADASATRRHGGCGVGLSIVKGFAEAMAGEVGFESRPGAGSRFWFRVRCGVPPVDTLQPG